MKLEFCDSSIHKNIDITATIEGAGKFTACDQGTKGPNILNIDRYLGWRGNGCIFGINHNEIE